MKTVALLTVSLALTSPAAPPFHVDHVPPSRVDPVETVLLTSSTQDTLRSRLLALMSNPTPPLLAAQAAFFRGLSFERGAMPDSAVTCYRQATATGRNPAAVEALVDVLLRRRAPGDVAEATALLEKLQAGEDEVGPRAGYPDPARLGWAYVLAGQAKRGLRLLGPLESRLADDPAWQYRFARAYIDSGNSTRAAGYLIALNAAARGQDREITDMLDRIDKRLGSTSRLHQMAEQAVRARDDAEGPLLRRLGGRRVRLLASDGAFIGGAAFADSNAKRPLRAALVLADLGDELNDYDSLTVALRSSGFAVFVVEPRGSGWSVAPQFSLPDTWEGRQQALSARVAQDVHDAIHGFRHLARVDTTRVLLIGVGASAPIAVVAAADEPRLAALVLLDPWTSPVDRGATLAAATHIRAPGYVHVGVVGRSETAFDDTLFHTLPQGPSRIVESAALRGGAEAFGSRPDITPRFVRWLDEAFTSQAARRGTPRSTPRSR
jgi:dienelactone hydrolase